MTTATEYVAPHAFIDFVKARGYRAIPITNTTAASEGADLQIVAYELRGPRGNKKVVGKNRDGLLPLFDAKLWCDGVDYATAKTKRA